MFVSHEKHEVTAEIQKFTVTATPGVDGPNENNLFGFIQRLHTAGALQVTTRTLPADESGFEAVQIEFFGTEEEPAAT